MSPKDTYSIYERSFQGDLLEDPLRLYEGKSLEEAEELLEYLKKMFPEDFFYASKEGLKWTL